MGNATANVSDAALAARARVQEEKRAYWTHQPADTGMARDKSVKNKDGVLTPIFKGEVPMGALWGCNDVAILRSFAASTVADAAMGRYAAEVLSGHASANDPVALAAQVSEVLQGFATVRGLGITADKAPGVLSVLKAQKQAVDNAIEALQEAQASGDKKALAAAIQALIAAKG